VFAPTTFYDQILYRASLASDIQYNIMNLLTGSPKIPQTNMGQARLLHAVDRAAQKKVDQGFLAAGVWIGPDVLNLKTGDPLSAGYLSQSESYVKQDPADTAARKAMPIYLTVIEAGAVNSIVVAVDVQV